MSEKRILHTNLVGLFYIYTDITRHIGPIKIAQVARDMNGWPIYLVDDSGVIYNFGSIFKMVPVGEQ